MLRLKSLPEVLEPVLRGIEPVAARELPLADAIGSYLADDLVALRPVPGLSIAVRSGVAVSSLEVAGASPQAPVMLAEMPGAVKPGEALPAGADAVLDASAIVTSGPMTLVTDAAPPGANVLLAGQHLAAGAVIAHAGRRITAETVLACGEAGIETVRARRLAVTLALGASPVRDWLAARLLALGCDVGAGEGHGEIVVTSAAAAEPRIALRPGGEAWCERCEDGTIRIEVPGRWDGAVAAYAALLLPLLAARLGTRMRMLGLPLTRKLVSAVGVSELALLQVRGGAAEPLAAGELTLAALAQADAFSLIDAGSEGYAAGERVAAFSLAAPLG